MEGYVKLWRCSAIQRSEAESLNVSSERRLAISVLENAESFVRDFELALNAEPTWETNATLVSYPVPNLLVRAHFNVPGT